MLTEKEYLLENIRYYFDQTRLERRHHFVCGVLDLETLNWFHPTAKSVSTMYNNLHLLKLSTPVYILSISCVIV